MSDYLSGLIVGMALNDNFSDESENRTEYYYDNTKRLKYGISKELVKFEVYKNKQVKAVVDKLKASLNEKIDKAVQNSELAIQKHSEEFEKLNAQKEEIYKKVEAMGFTLTKGTSDLTLYAKSVNTNYLDNCVKTENGYKFDTFYILPNINDCRVSSSDIKNSENFYQRTYDFICSKIEYKYEDKGGLGNFILESQQKIAEMESKTFRLKNFPSFKRKYTMLLAQYYNAVHDSTYLNELKMVLKRAGSLSEEDKQTILAFGAINQKLMKYSAETEEIQMVQNLKKVYSEQFSVYSDNASTYSYKAIFNELFAEALRELDSKDSKILGSFVNEFASFAVENPKMLEQIATTPSNDYGWEEEIIFNQGLVGSINQMVEQKARENELLSQKRNMSNQTVTDEELDDILNQ